jgi:DNA-binding NtrC family response regulator
MERETGAADGLIGRSPAMDRLRQQIAKFGPINLRVHVFGETGSGKELVARALHEASPRARKAIVPVNVAAVPDELFLPELFGRVRGAFTSAVDTRDGYVAAAEGGTLFLDEVGDMSSAAQAALLRFLEGGEYRRVGEASLRRADVWVISATNVDLDRRVADGRFREDLLYRLRDQTIRVPPLRERGDDVLLLARHFLAAATRCGERVPALSREAESALLCCSWPGNVRQLQGEMRRAAVLAAGRDVERDDLSPALQRPTGGKAGTLRSALDRCEDELVRATLERHGGVQARAAAELGITRQSLWAKVRRRGLAGAGGGQVLSSRASRGGTQWRSSRETGAEEGGPRGSAISPAAGA